MKGFTLLEMTLATALLAMLMIGVLAVIASMAPAVQATQPLDPPGFPTPRVLDALIRQLTRDLAQSNIAMTSDNSIRITGPLSLDNASYHSHQPANVEYTLQDIAGERWLVRIQTQPDIPTNQNQRIDLVCRGIDHFELISLSSPIQSKPDLWRLKLWSSPSESPACVRHIIASPEGLR